VRVEAYELRDGSAGGGQYRGGEGLVRAIRVLGHEARVSLQSERRRFAPYGLQGGRDGKPGRNAVIRADGRVEEQPGKATVSLGAGDVVIVETPRRAGCGKAPYPGGCHSGGYLDPRTYRSAAGGGPGYDRRVGLSQHHRDDGDRVGEHPAAERGDHAGGGRPGAARPDEPASRRIGRRGGLP